MVYNQELANRLRAAVAARSESEEKQMFGGRSFMVGGQMCCGVLKDDLVVRVGEAFYDEAIALPHVRPFDFTGRPSTGLVYVASAGLTTDQALDAWVKRAVDYVTANPRTAKPSAKRS